MIIQIPNNFISERKYIINVLLENFLGLKFEIEVKKDLENYNLILENHSKIIFSDNFFSKILPNNFLDKKYLPENVIFAENIFTSEKNIPVLFGNEKISIETEQIICGNDIFASSFFMLTRWEEHVYTKKDKFGRFPEEQSLAVRMGFEQRPIVNEYVEMLWNMLISLGFEQRRKSLTYTLKITHDVDFYKKFNGIFDVIKTFFSELLQKTNVNPFKSLVYNCKIWIGKENDPYDVFDFLMQTSEENNLKSHFYFIPNNKTRFSNYSIKNKQVIRTIQKIIDRKHIIGYHASWIAFENAKVFENEVNMLSKIAYKPIEGRQHFLRFKSPETWRIWEQFDFKEDSTIGFSKRIGFRAGVCYSYPVFDFLQKKQLQLIENPLIVMDTAFLHSKKNTEQLILETIKIGKIVKKYNGNLVLLWHNNNINYNFGKNFSQKYRFLIKELKNLQE